MIADHLKSRHTGRENAVSAAALCTYFGISDRELRDVVRSEREAGAPIISLDSGYYWPVSSTDEGALHCVQKLRAHAVAELVVATEIEAGLEALAWEPEQLALEV